MIIFDTETTGLIKYGSPLEDQPKIIEFAGIKVDEKLKIIDKMEVLIDPGEPLSDIIVKITGLTDAKLKGKPSFPKVYPGLCEFFLGQSSMLAHNLPFDRDLLSFDLERMDRLCKFPWPSEHLCSIELTRHLKKKKLKMVDLYEIAMGKELDQKHRAMDDVMALFSIVKWMRKEKILTDELKGEL